MEQGIFCRKQRSVPRELRKLRCETPWKCGCPLVAQADIVEGARKVGF